MLFNSVSFAVFFAAVGVACHRVTPRHRANVLLASSLLFYFFWIPPYLLLLVVDIAVNYALLRAICRSRRPAIPLAASCLFSLSLLAYYKYAAFLVVSAAPILGRFGGDSPLLPYVLLPLGISFYTFQILGLAIDARRRSLREAPGLRDYALFVSFFPQLVAGPILRGDQLLPQIAAGGRPSAALARRGLWLVASGLVKKVVLSDFLLAPQVDRVFGQPGVASAPEHLIAVYAFAFVIYFDFSGYTDMARGLARMLGFELPLNFRTPYLSRSPAEFWRRWHITLSTWLRDYLYIPLGGNRGGGVRTALNLMATMLLGGLWHGAAWTFVAWGALHGAWLVVDRLVRRRARVDAPVTWRDAARIALCFHVVCALWIPFRAASFEDALTITDRILTGSYLAGWPLLETALIVLCGLLQVAERAVRERPAVVRRALAGRTGALVEGIALGAVAALVAYLGGAGSEFIYFQF